MKYEEVQQLRQRPHPHEFVMYYDAWWISPVVAKSLGHHWVPR
jgi:hypothetical protein